MKHAIRNRWNGEVIFEAKLPAEYDSESDNVRLGAAVKLAVKSGANLAGADLTGADLVRADLAGADLTGANLARANLAGADLQFSQLDGADLAGASLVGANLARASHVISAGAPDGWTCVGWLRDGWLSIRVGCRDKRLAEGRAYWAEKNNRREVLAALDYVEAVAKLRGWKTEEPK